MAIQTGKYIKAREEEAAAKSISEQLSAASSGEQKRKGRSGLFGKVGGFLAGEGLQMGGMALLTALSGGAAGPLLAAIKASKHAATIAKLARATASGIGMFAGKAAAHAGTKGELGKWLKTSGQVEDITADSKYGFGEEEAASFSEELAKSRESEQDWGTLAGDIIGAGATEFAGTKFGDLFPKSTEVISGWPQARGGGYVPKFKKGGGLFKKFGKKKEPERDEALMALEAILSGEYELKEGEHEYPFGRNVASGETYPDGSNLVRTIAKFSTPEGERYYPGEGKSRDNSLANTIAMMEAAQRAYHSPADSITTDQLAKLKELGLFAGGGQVPKYYGGGSVQSDTPTILDYFSKQGKTLGGSNTQPLSQILGRK